MIGARALARVTHVRSRAALARARRICGAVTRPLLPVGLTLPQFPAAAGQVHQVQGGGGQSWRRGHVLSRTRRVSDQGSKELTELFNQLDTDASGTFICHVPCARAQWLLEQRLTCTRKGDKAEAALAAYVAVERPPDVASPPVCPPPRRP